MGQGVGGEPRHKDVKKNLLKITTGDFPSWLGDNNPTSTHEDAGLSPTLAQWVKDPVLLWLWYRPAAAPEIQLLAWELPHAANAALKRQKKKKKKKKKKKITTGMEFPGSLVV